MWGNHIYLRRIIVEKLPNPIRLLTWSQGPEFAKGHFAVSGPATSSQKNPNWTVKFLDEFYLSMTFLSPVGL